MITWNRGGQTGDQTRKVSRQQTKSSRIGGNVEPWVVVSFYRLVKIWNSPWFPDEFRNGQ